MKNINIKYTLIFLLISAGFMACQDDYDDQQTSEQDIKNFIWNGLNDYYLWQPEEPLLADNRFPNTWQLDTFLEGYETPNELFEELLVARTTDRFSVMYSDYLVLESLLQGSALSSGIDYELRYTDDTQTNVFGWVRYVLPNSDAANKGITRGMIFYAVNGTQLTASNYRSLLTGTNYSLHFANYNNGNITSNGQIVNLNLTNVPENPVYAVNIFEQGSKKIGYILYNGFYQNYEAPLNDAFAQLKAENATHLILDLRYNSGGSIATAIRLASMITGQFSGQIFGKQLWNPKVMAEFGADSETFINRFTNYISNGSAIQSLNLTKVYVLTSPRTASASELLINNLKPYINVVQIGEKTTGKNVGSITLYDSQGYNRPTGAVNHRYAMQPIVLKMVDKNNFGNYSNGLQPHVPFIEDLGNLGVLGTASEPFLQTALQYIQNTNGRLATPKTTPIHHTYLNDRKSMQPLGNEMYLD